MERQHPEGETAAAEIIMAVTNRNKSHKPPSGSRIAALVMVLLVIASVGGYFFLNPPRDSARPPKKSELSHVEPGIPGSSTPQTPGTKPPTVPQQPHKEQSITPPPAVPEIEQIKSVVGTPARLAIIIDDMGSSMSEARLLAAIKVPLTFAIIPGLHVDKKVADYAGSQHIETMIHIPMQAKGWPARRLESDGLLVAMETEELQERVTGFVQQFPGVVGANNHMGSEFTEQDGKMEAVLTILKKNNLFFIDSVTTPESTGLRVAQRLGVRSARRNVFLDNEQEQNYIRGQLKQAVRLARKNGSAIAICHPHPVTIATLAAELPGLAGQGVRLVPASQLVR